MSLDCQTRKGLGWLDAQRQTLDVFVTQHPDLDCIQTSTAGAAVIDALLARNGTLVALAEVKSRNATLDGLRAFGTYLVSAQKIQTGQQLSALLRVPFLLIVGLRDAVIWWKMTDADGVLLLPLNIEASVTQRSVNGGSVMRDNAYLAYQRAHVIQVGIQIPEAVA